MSEHRNRRVAIVTGAAAGIGLATVEVLLRDGWQVVGLDRNADTVAAARERFGGSARFEAADVTDAGRMAAVVAEAGSLGPVRGLVTSAGIAANIPFLDTAESDFRRMYEVNVIGTALIARVAAEAMRSSGGGSIVTVASVSGLVGNLGRAAYGASKGAVVNLTRILAVELAKHGIRVNAVAPGPIETDMARAVHSAAVRAQWCRDVPLGRYGEPREVAEAAAFLLDDRASYVTGQVLAVDGGFVAAGLTDLP